MKWRWLGLLAVVAAAVAIIAYKELALAPRDSSSARVPGGTPPAVLLFADPHEAESSCGCGQIIRIVREAAKHGISVREIAPGSEPDALREHRVIVARSSPSFPPFVSFR